MDLNALRLFIATAQAGSLSKAAEKIGVPLPTLSRRLTELENELKTQLLDRGRKGVRLTTSGQRLFDQTFYNIEALLEAERNVKSDLQNLHGKLRLSLPPNFEFWGELIIAFQQAYPNIDVSCHYTDMLLDLTQDQIDVALRIGELYTDKVRAKKCPNIRHYLYASPEFIERFGTPSAPNALAEYALAGWHFSRSMANFWHLADEKFVPELRFSANNFNVLCDYALAGMAITELPEFIARPHLESGRLVKIFAEYPLLDLNVHLIYAAHRHPSTIVRAYLAFCESWLQTRFK
ncbi:LysR family transcriptional regulator [Conservatibacter flavescens]|uniref:LysR family transcriptional regulator n=1 Tax=Conservatibacter flavescens TaxID=28161 RepID=A0A2M8S192_9PAST|nr:LysR family transcriptional regulator [Conservatibacter flavescens]PJG84913.1 LysR family transcriptional regulator [Conservatibacter flavescens]